VAEIQEQGDVGRPSGRSSQGATLKPWARVGPRSSSGGVR
jgi:hypothetical protein